MKQIFPILLILLCSFYMTASDTTIVFKQVSHADIFELAKKENKGVMLYFHFDGCGACAQMEKTAFKDNKVADLFNSHFVNLDINILKEEGAEVNKLYDVKLYPTFLFFDKDGNELHRIVGVFSPEEFHEQGRSAILSDANLSNYKRLYASGIREVDFLFDYSYMLRNASELDSTVVNEYLDLIEEKDYRLEKNIKYMYEFCIHKNNFFLPYNNPKSSFLIENKELFYEYLDRDQVRTRVAFILIDATYKAIADSDEETFNELISALEEFDIGERYLFKEMDGRITAMLNSRNLILTAKLQYYDKVGDKSQYFNVLNAYLDKIWDDGSELNSFAWGVFEQAQDDEIEKVETALRCSARSIELENNYANNDTYAWLLYKSGELKKALSQANKAVEVAKKNNEDYSETQVLIDRISREK